MSQPLGIAPTTIAPVDAPNQDAAQQLASDLRGRWVGEGINTLWVPTSAGVPTPTPPPMYQPVASEPPKPLPRFVSSRTTETLVIDAPLGSVPNKGPGDEFSEVAAPYEQRVYDENGNLVHAENGFWLATPSTQSPQAVASIAKLSSIPHGSVAVVQGALPSRQDGLTQISVSVSAPAVPSGVPGLVQPDGPLAPEFIQDVAAYVAQRVAADRTGVLWELQLQSTGVVSIAFLQQNAPVTSVQSTVWVGNLGVRSDGAGAGVASVLAYVQTAVLTFDGFQWPHVSVGYLLRDMEWRS